MGRDRRSVAEASDLDLAEGVNLMATPPDIKPALNQVNNSWAATYDLARVATDRRLDDLLHVLNELE